MQWIPADGRRDPWIGRAAFRLNAREGGGDDAEGVAEKWNFLRGLRVLDGLDGSRLIGFPMQYQIHRRVGLPVKGKPAYSVAWPR